LIGLHHIRIEIRKILITKERESLEKYEALPEILSKKNTYVYERIWPLARLAKGSGR
jgi:hypothetical protein